MSPEDLFRSRMARARKARGLTQQALANATGVPRGAIAKIECGVRRPSLNDATVIAAAVGASLDALVSDGDVEMTVTI